MGELVPRMRTRSWEDTALGATRQGKMAERHQLLSPVSYLPGSQALGSLHPRPTPHLSSGEARRDTLKMQTGCSLGAHRSESMPLSVLVRAIFIEGPVAWGWKPPCAYGGERAASPTEGIPCGASPQVLIPTPPPHRPHTCFDPKQIRCGNGGGHVTERWL